MLKYCGLYQKSSVNASQISSHWTQQFSSLSGEPRDITIIKRLTKDTPLKIVSLTYALHATYQFNSMYPNPNSTCAIWSSIHSQGTWICISALGNVCSYLFFELHLCLQIHCMFICLFVGVELHTGCLEYLQKFICFGVCITRLLAFPCSLIIALINAQEVLIYNKKIKELLPDLQIYLSLKTSPERDEKAAASSGFVCPLLQTNSSFYRTNCLFWISNINGPALVRFPNPHQSASPNYKESIRLNF